MDTKIPREVEVKLLVPRASLLRTIAQVRRLGLYRLRPRQTVRLYTLYLDTPTFSLARRGVAVRLRRNRARWEASIKWSGREDGLIHERPELTVRLPQAPTFPFISLPEPLRERLSGLIGGQGLIPILLSDVRRQRFAVFGLRQTNTPALAELALDRVHLRDPRAGRRTAATYYEVEIELEPAGKVRDLLEVAKLLQERFALTPADDSKFSRGLTLLYGPKLMSAERLDERCITSTNDQAAERRRTRKARLSTASGQQQGKSPQRPTVIRKHR
jgi:inorganic triphosphatase YgiF